jgi:hypothetical protein
MAWKTTKTRTILMNDHIKQWTDEGWDVAVNYGPFYTSIEVRPRHYGCLHSLAGKVVDVFDFDIALRFNGKNLEDAMMIAIKEMPTAKITLRNCVNRTIDRLFSIVDGHGTEYIEEVKRNSVLIDGGYYPYNAYQDEMDDDLGEMQ